MVLALAPFTPDRVTMGNNRVVYCSQFLGEVGCGPWANCISYPGKV